MSLWPQAQWAAQSEPSSAAWDIAIPDAPPRLGKPQWQVWAAWQREPEPVQRVRRLAQPKTGDEPPPYSVAEVYALFTSWPQPQWEAQGSVESLAWHVALEIAPVPPAAKQWHLWSAWQGDAYPVQARPSLAWHIALELPPVLAPRTAWQVWDAWRAEAQPTQALRRLVQPNLADEPPRYTVRTAYELVGAWSQGEWGTRRTGKQTIDGPIVIATGSVHRIVYVDPAGRTVSIDSEGRIVTIDHSSRTVN